MTHIIYRVSVVVPTFRRPDLLERCLSALTTQDIDPTDYEIIIVDDAACDDTRMQVECWIEYTKGCAFTDDDCLPNPDWLQAGLAAFHEGIVGVSGKIIVPLEHTPTDYERNAALLAKAEFVTANCFYRRDALTMVGGFDEHFTMAWREDSDLVFRLLEQVSPDIPSLLAYAPKAVVVHPVRPSSWGASLRQQHKSMFNALLYKKHPALYRQRIQATPPLHYYCILGTLLVTLMSTIAGYWLLGLGAVCVWILMTGRFCLLRLDHTSHSPRHILEMIVTSILIPPLAIFWRIAGAIRFRVFFL